LPDEDLPSDFSVSWEGSGSDIDTDFGDEDLPSLPKGFET